MRPIHVKVQEAVQVQLAPQELVAAMVQDMVDPYRLYIITNKGRLIVVAVAS